MNHSIFFAWGNLSALSRSSLRTGVVDDADSARPVDASTRKLKYAVQYSSVHFKASKGCSQKELIAE